MSGVGFDDNSISREIELIAKEPKFISWKSPSGESFQLNLPHTVYPPREDTNLLASRLIKLGSGKGRKCLEIGTGSGILSLLCRRQGWRVEACDINPIAVASARELFKQNYAEDIQVSEGGPGPKEDGKIKQWAKQENYDLIFWNLPYLKITKDAKLLGPLEDAALIETEGRDLFQLIVTKIDQNKLLSNDGIGLFLVGESKSTENLVSIAAKSGFACRITDTDSFDDGEQIKIVAVWRPFAKAKKIHQTTVTSTSTELLSSSWPIGSSLSSDYQTNGHGRRGRRWDNASEVLACSWKIGTSFEISPNILQLICGFIVKQSLQQYNQSPHTIQIIQKWPNDILLKQDGKIGKVCGVLIESISKGNVSETVIGIGINLSTSEEMPVYEMPASFADSLDKEISRQIIQTEIDCRLAGLFEDITNIPKTNFLAITNLASKSIIDGFTTPRELLYRNKKVSFHSVKSDGCVIVCDENNQQIICDEGESLKWNF
tara:strand:- start:309 stop:1775 length:1467 start_codon:yes stop_codon:yes gene_type:complete